MRLQHTFDLPGDVDDAVNLLSRIDEIAPCLPGASATRESDDRFNGTMRVRMGPLDMSFKGTIELVEREPAAGRVTLKSKGSETRGRGTASATTVASLTSAGDTTHVVLDTDLTISGRVAQMGRGILIEISNDLLDRFVAKLKAKLAERTSAARAPVTSAAAPEAVPASAGPPLPATTSPVASLSGTDKHQSLDAVALVWRVLRRRLARLLGFSDGRDV